MSKQIKESKKSGTGKLVQLTQVGSSIGRDVRVLGTLRALGLGRRGKKSEIALNEATAGMIKRVGYLLSVSEK